MRSSDGADDPDRSLDEPAREAGVLHLIGSAPRSRRGVWIPGLHRGACGTVSGWDLDWVHEGTLELSVEDRGDQESWSPRGLRAQEACSSPSARYASAASSPISRGVPVAWIRPLSMMAASVATATAVVTNCSTTKTVTPLDAIWPTSS